MGGEQQPAEARIIGSTVARLGHILLTGASIGDNSSQRIHKAAMHEASLVESARLIGILPRQALEARDRADCHFEPLHVPKGFYFHAGLTSEQRDSITGLTPDAVIFLKGSSGTLRELAYAVTGERNMYFVDCVDFLHKKLHATSSARKNDFTLIEAQRLCNTVNGHSISVVELKERAGERLAVAEDWERGLHELVMAPAENALAEWPRHETGFPLFLGQPVKREFERRVPELE
jgi:predicted Rossmann-fold nucleotide-binding protein